MTGIAFVDPIAYGASTGISKLDGLLLFMRAIGGRYVLQITWSPQSVNKAQWLLDGGRDFFSVTPEMQQAIAAEMIAALRGQSQWDAETARRGLLVAAEAARQFIVKRFERGGFDQHLAALSPLYASFKAKHHLDPRIGIAHADMLNELKSSARFEFVKQAA